MDGARHKEPKSLRQEGPFGHPETVAPIAELNNGANYWQPKARASEDKTNVKAEPEAQLKVKATLTPSLPTLDPKTDEDDRSQTGSYDAPLVVEAERTAASECTSPQCGELKKWFEEVVVSQADPCRERNTFVCNASLILPGWDGMAGKTSSDQRMLPRTHSGTASAKEGATGAGRSKEAVGLSELSELCLRYAWNPEEGVEDILMFLSQFKLDLRKITDDATEDLLERMMELSFGYGLNPVVSFSMQYSVTSVADHAVILQISTSSELEEFFWSLERMDEEAVEDFYRLVLTRYALVQDTDIAQLLQENDEAISDILNVTADPSPWAKMSIAEVSETTGVSAALWKKLLRGYCPFQSTCEDYIVTDKRALALVAFMARDGETLNMRRQLAWHTLLHLVGAKADVLALLNRTGSKSDYHEDYDFATSSESKCERLLHRVSGIRGEAIDLFEGDAAVPAESIVSVANFMAQFQNAIASIISSPSDNKADRLAVSAPVLREETFADENQTLLQEEQHGYPFAAFRHIEGTEVRGLAPKEMSFPVLWLRRLRAWHALPPLLQVLLPGIASLTDVTHLGDLFRMPYYDARTLAAYNFASLGHVIARVVAHKLDELRRTDKFVDQQWRSFVEDADIIDSRTTYCAEALINENDTWRQKKVNLSDLLEETLMNHVAGLKIAHVALLRSSNTTMGYRSEGQLLPGVRLSSKELFLLMHCALSCALGARGFNHFREERHCMVVYRSSRPFIDRPCARPTHENVLNDCRYV
ncbi:uncharacterized protein LOC142792739 [Rhipicephalus microplus]|uniref:uncharacterized protein LOC142792739 n=1 Tax=Rhipicephalus microplus TaxID=6941 RepID=UPI003F6B7356